jgi:CO/xanthine dehydrogenase FAD-binding subunit
MRQVLRYAKPTSVEDALALLGETPWRILAGGTDFYPALGAKPLRENVLDINGLEDLRGISETPDHIVIGARTSWSDVARHPLPRSFDALKQAAREVGSIQIQNAGTVAGNLCNASPAADGVPALMILDAEVELRSIQGRRWLPLQDFVLGNRRTALRQDELLTAVRMPKAAAAGGSAFFKLGARRYLVISIAMAAARISVEAEVVKSAAVAIGACSAVAMRLEKLEAALIGQPADASTAGLVAPEYFEALTPIDDVRGSAAYRHEAAREIAVRAILAALGIDSAGAAGRAAA